MQQSIEVNYYIIVYLSLVYLLWKVKVNKIGLLVILIFWGGAISYFGIQITNIFKIFIVLYSLILFSKSVILRVGDHDRFVNVSFLVFSFVFLISYVLNGGEIFTVLSQYFFKFGLVFLFYHGLKDVSFNIQKREYLKNLLLQILYIQVFLSIIKILLFGFAFEHIVGSMSNGGAGIAVVLPVMAMIFYWLVHLGKLTMKDWIIMSGFFLIALASGKRAPVILFPVFLLLILGYVQKSIRFLQIIKAVPLLFIIVFFGAKLTPSLNPEGKIMGSFEINHIINYSFNYTFGTSDVDKIYSDDYRSTGRGGSLFLLFQPKKIGLSDVNNVLFGKGVYESVTKVHGKFVGGDAYGIEHSSLVGEHIKIIFSLGYLGFISMCLFALSVISTVNNKKLRLVLLLFYIWELLLYYNQVVFSHGSALIIIFVCFFANSLSMKWLNPENLNIISINSVTPE